jgi:cytochrome oxidase Cu insertion factor (SCO1/SenC/PrrC family)
MPWHFNAPTVYNPSGSLGQKGGRMKRNVLALVLLAGLLLFVPLAGHSRASAQANDTMATTTLKVGDVAPDFTLLSDQSSTPVKLSDYRGKKNVILAFYVLAFTGG